MVDAVSKKKTIAGLVNDAAVLLQKKVRLKAALHDDARMVQCVTCRKWDHWTKMQGGHFISRTHTKHKLSEENIHPQCQRCNGFLNGNYIAYSLYMQDMYGREWVENMLATKTEVKKYYRPEILDIIEELKAEVKDLESKL